MAKMLADPATIEKLAENKRPATQVTGEETRRAVAPEQWQHFQALLRQSNFWQMVSCKPSFLTDGAEWLLEAHQADGYHMVLRQSPGKGSAFRAACEYLLDLSSARKEKRY